MDTRKVSEITVDELLELFGLQAAQFAAAMKAGGDLVYEALRAAGVLVPQQ